MNIGQLVAALGLDTDQFTKAMAVAQVAMNSMDQSVKKVDTTTKTLSQSMSKVGANIDAVGQKFRTFGYLATATLTVPIVAAGKSMVKTAADFEFSMTKITGLVGISKEQVSQWSDAVLKMGKETAQSPNKLADALYHVSSAGFKTNEALELTKMAALGASTGMGDAADIAKFLVSAMNAYSKSGLTAARTMDVLTAGIREGAVEPDGFAQALGSVLPVASKLKVPLEDVVSSMASMSLTGSNAAQAATYLRNILNKLIEPSSQTEEALKGMHTSSAQFVKVIQRDGLLAGLEAMSKLLEQYPDKLGEVFPNIRELIGYLSLTGDKLQDNKKILYEVTNSTGSFNYAISQASQTLRWKYDAAMAAVTESKIKMGAAIGDVLLPMLDSLVKKVEKLSKWFTSLTKSQQESVVNWGLFLAAMGPVSLMLSTLIYAVSGLTKGIFFLRKEILLLNGTKISSSVMSFLGASSKFLVKNPWVAVAASAAVAIPMIIKANNEIKITGDLLQKMKEDSDALTAGAGDGYANLQKLVKQYEGIGSMDSKGLLELLKGFSSLNTNALGEYFNTADGKVMKVSLVIKDIQERLKTMGVDPATGGSLAIVDQLGDIEKLELRIEAIQERITKSRSEEERQALMNVNEQLDQQLTLLRTIRRYRSSSIELQGEKQINNLPKVPITGADQISAAMGMKNPLKEKFEPAIEQIKILDGLLKDSLMSTVDNISQSFGQMWDIIVEGAGEGQTAMQAFGQVVMNTINNIVRDLIVAIAKALIFKAILAAFSGGTSTIATGITKLITGASTPSVSLASGGLAYGNTLAQVGEYAGAGSNPEVIAPLDRLKSILGSTGQMSGDVRFVIDGDKLVGILSKQNKRNSIY